VKQSFFVSALVRAAEDFAATASATVKTNAVEAAVSDASV
jgi:hypothetical protein